MSEDPLMDELEAYIVDELKLAESSRPDDPAVGVDGTWQLDPTAAQAYEVRMLALRGAVEAVGDHRTIRPEPAARSTTLAGSQNRATEDSE
jgi:hypothetical protein